MKLPSIGTPFIVPEGWADNESYTVKVWRAGSCQSIHHYTDLQESVRTTEAQLRFLNALSPDRPLRWYRLGSEVKLAADVWRESDTVAYLTCDRIGL